MAEPAAFDNTMHRGERACAPSPQTPRPQPHSRATVPKSVARKLSFSGVVLLCIAGFLPQVPSCGRDIVPFLEGPDFMLVHGLPFIFAVFAAAAFAAMWLIKSEKWSRFLGWAVYVFTASILAYAFYLVLGTCIDLSRPLDIAAWHWPTLAVFCCLLAISVASLVLLVKARFVPKVPACFFLCGVSSLVYFSFFVGNALFGLWVSILACLLIVGGSGAEVIHVLRTPTAPP